ncbi:hypothetical protein GGF46_005552 [Coemansia sp. RSA 552]|nr:hypothetical protein GGF46_005552 [Coemansia sp. RSA 552]
MTSRVSQSPTVGRSGSRAATAGARAGCPHIAQRTKAIIDRLKVLVPYAHVSGHRQALLQGRRGASTTVAAAAPDGQREATPAGGGAEGDRSRKRLVEEMPAPACFRCSTPADRLHVCLSCDFFGCWRGCGRRKGEPHIVEHLRTADHAFALDFTHQQLFCRECNDYVYDAAVGGWLMGTRIRWHAALCDAAEPEAKRPRIVSTGADLSPAQTRYLREHGSVRPCTGVRGLANLGATCYLSVVLQALVHNPLVRGWMLSDGHHQSQCRISDQTGGRDPCMACELEAVFQAFYSNDSAAVSAVGSLRTLWRLRSDMAGYGQQDAHECLVAVLDALHVGLTENKQIHTHLSPCSCLVHQVFAGVLQSTVTCSRCGNATVAHDPMLDVSLDIPPPRGRATRTVDAALREWAAVRQNSHAGSSRSQGPRIKPRYPVPTLQDCLAHYTRAERLAPGAYTCARCGAADAAATKQLCMKELPPVLTFQLKRFGQRNDKIDSFVRLPLHVDMTPYTAAAHAARQQTVSSLRASAGAATTNTGSALPSEVGGVSVRDADAPGAPPPPKDTPVPVLDGPGGATALGKRRTDATHSNPACTYRLFAVIDHVGHLDTGHYTASALHRGHWYRFDDASVRRVNVRDVLGFADEAAARAGRPARGSAYMAFYAKTTLDYHDGAAGQTASNTRISESGEWIEDAGVVRTRINPNGDVKIERRGRKKGSTNARKPAKRRRPSSSLPPEDDDDGEHEERLVSGSLDVPPAVPGPPPAPSPSDSGSDAEALWTQMSKATGLVPMADPHHVRNDPPLFINPADLASSPVGRTSEYAPTNEGPDLDDDDDDDDNDDVDDLSDFA